MNFSNEDVTKGVDAALKRLTKIYPDPMPLLDNEAKKVEITNTISEFLGSYDVKGASINSAYVQLFAEILAISALIREHNAEPKLNSDALQAAMGFLSWLLNSYKHF